MAFRARPFAGEGGRGIDAGHCVEIERDELCKRTINFSGVIPQMHAYIVSTVRRQESDFLVITQDRSERSKQDQIGLKL